MNNRRDPSYWSPPGFEQPPYPNYHTPSCPPSHNPPPPPPPHRPPFPTVNPNVFTPNQCCHGKHNSGDDENYRIPVLEAFPWQEAVKSKSLVVPPTNPSKGDRYLIFEQGAGSWNKLQNYIAWFDGYEWHYDFPLPGWILYVQDEDKFYRYNGSVWIDNKKDSTADFGNITESNVIYVGNIDNSNDFGTETDPFSSIKKAIELIINKGDNKFVPYVIKLLPGSYNETIFLEDVNLYNIYIIGSGSRNTFVGLLGSGSVQSLNATNKNLTTLNFSNLTFLANVNVKGNEQLDNGMYLEFTNCKFNSNLFITNLYHPIFNGRCEFMNNVTISNCARAEFFNDCLIQKPEIYFINVSTDNTVETPLNWEGMTKVIFHCNVSRKFRYSLINSASAYIGFYNAECGINDEVYEIPKNVTFEGINSFFRGSVLVDGEFILSNSFVQNRIVKNWEDAIINFKNQKISQIYDDLGVTKDSAEAIKEIKRSIIDVANNIQYDRRLKTLLLEPGLVHD